ncbi:MAG: transcriptional regulator [Clostridiales bacterium 43-6]|mgnify:CR=1 FL=1|nr:MAG: transcriptional regulator [Clostridiales bacterium 43-6]
MSGHSKWSTIKRKKEKTDAGRAKIFTKIGREMTLAVRSGGTDPASNTKLRDCIAKAKANNVPNDNIDRIIKKAAGEGDTSNYEEIVYEGYGPGGVAVIVETLTDNRNRTAADIRHHFDKYGGNLGLPGSVMFLFQRQGILIIDAEGKNEDNVLEAALDSGAEDFVNSGDVFEVITDPNGLGGVRESLEAKGYSFLSAEVEYVPSTTAKLDAEGTLKMQKLLELLDDNDDVQDVWHNWDSPEEE